MDCLSLLQEIKEWLSENVPGALESLNSSATEWDLRKLKFALPSATPSQIFQLLAVHNGERGDLRNGLLPDGFRLLPVKDILEAYLYALKNPGETPEEGLRLLESRIRFAKGAVFPICGNAFRIPFAACNFEIFWQIDLIPAPGGKIGQIIREDVEDGSWEVISDSLESLLHSYLQALKAGLFVIDFDGNIQDENDLWRPN